MSPYEYPHGSWFKSSATTQSSWMFHIKITVGDADNMQGIAVSVSVIDDFNLNTPEGTYFSHCRSIVGDQCIFLITFQDLRQQFGTVDSYHSYSFRPQGQVSQTTTTLKLFSIEIIAAAITGA